MSGIHLYKYHESRHKGEGLRIGVTRYPPRGVRGKDYAKLDYFDLRLPLLAPGAELLKAYKRGNISFKTFAIRYRREMAKPECKQLIALLAAFAQQSKFSLGCFCDDESRCHRSLLKQLILEAASVNDKEESSELYSSPVCDLKIEEH